MSELPENWVLTGINDLLLPFANGQTLRQGWSPQCENFPSQSQNDWGVLKTTAIQDGEFQPEHNKQLPSSLEPDALLEVEIRELFQIIAVADAVVAERRAEAPDFGDDGIGAHQTEEVVLIQRA